jgi:hypothetical protein
LCSLKIKLSTKIAQSIAVIPPKPKKVVDDDEYEGVVEEEDDDFEENGEEEYEDDNVSSEEEEELFDSEEEPIERAPKRPRRAKSVKHYNEDAFLEAEQVFQKVEILQPHRSQQGEEQYCICKQV